MTQNDQQSATSDVEAALLLSNNKKSIIWASRFKSKLCDTYTKTGECSYGYHCMFAHGHEEVRTKEMNFTDGLISENAIKRFQQKAQFDALDRHVAEANILKAASNKAKLLQQQQHHQGIIPPPFDQPHRVQQPHDLLIKRNDGAVQSHHHIIATTTTTTTPPPPPLLPLPLPSCSIVAAAPGATPGAAPGAAPGTASASLTASCSSVGTSSIVLHDTSPPLNPTTAQITYATCAPTPVLVAPLHQQQAQLLPHPQQHLLPMAMPMPTTTAAVAVHHSSSASVLATPVLGRSNSSIGGAPPLPILLPSLQNQPLNHHVDSASILGLPLSLNLNGFSHVPPTSPQPPQHFPQFQQQQQVMVPQQQVVVPQQQLVYAPQSIPAMGVQQPQQPQQPLMLFMGPSPTQQPVSNNNATFVVLPQV